MVKSPCQNCTDRVYSCHTVCEKYKQFRTDLEVWKKNVFKSRYSAEDLYLLEKTRKKYSI